LIILVVIGLGAGLLWLRPFPAAEAAVAALASDDSVTVTATSDLITFSPRETARTGLIFYPGARVEPRAYAVLMRALAARGTATFIIKLPYDIAFFAQDRPTAIIAAHPEIHTWAIGGHSLGGVVACSYAAAHIDRVAGLLLYASYPASNLSATLANTAVLSLSGTNDGLATPAKIEQARPILPMNTRYVSITGGIHAFFGDYGAQPGDGQPTVGRAEAQAAIINASADFLATLDRR
jgi:predicted alpha/beta-hydrolase family hydrolase